MLEINHIKKSYGATLAVDDLSFFVHKGQCFGLLGPNGAGKSTTISIMVGALSADSGEVKIEGKAVTSETDPNRRRIGYVPQEIGLYEELSAVDNLLFFGSLYGPVSASRIETCLDLVGLRDRAKEPVRNFSGGMKRRLNIAVALVHDPDILVLDEPTVGVDPQSRNSIFDSLEALRRDGKTLLYTTHYMEEVERLCDQIAIIDHGKIIANDSLEGLLKLLPVDQVTRFSFVDDGLAEKAEEVLRGCPSATTVTRDGKAVSVGADDMSAALAESTAALRGALVLLDAIATQRPTLEEVFLYSTGRSLRDS